MYIGKEFIDASLKRRDSAFKICHALYITTLIFYFLISVSVFLFPSELDSFYDEYLLYGSGIATILFTIFVYINMALSSMPHDYSRCPFCKKKLFKIASVISSKKCHFCKKIILDESFSEFRYSSDTFLEKNLVVINIVYAFLCLILLGLLVFLKYFPNHESKDKFTVFFVLMLWTFGIYTMYIIRCNNSRILSRSCDKCPHCNIPFGASMKMLVKKNGRCPICGFCIQTKNIT